MANPQDQSLPLILLPGGSGYVGGRLIPLLEQQPVKLRCLARNPAKMRSRVKETTEIVRGDVLDPASLDQALQGVHTAYYLVHLLSGPQDFEEDERQAATTLVAKLVGTERKPGLRLVQFRHWRGHRAVKPDFGALDQVFGALVTFGWGAALGLFAGFLWVGWCSRISQGTGLPRSPARNRSTVSLVILGGIAPPWAADLIRPAQGACR